MSDGYTDASSTKGKENYSGVDIKNSQNEGMVIMVPKGDTSASEKKGIFNRSLFKYDAKKDVYTCPANKELTYRFTSFEIKMNLKRYFLDIFTCRACDLKSHAQLVRVSEKLYVGNMKIKLKTWKL